MRTDELYQILDLFKWIKTLQSDISLDFYRYNDNLKELYELEYRLLKEPVYVHITEIPRLSLLDVFILKFDLTRDSMYHFLN